MIEHTQLLVFIDVSTRVRNRKSLHCHGMVEVPLEGFTRDAMLPVLGLNLSNLGNERDEER